MVVGRALAFCGCLERVVLIAAVPREAALRRHVQFAADDRLDPGFLGFEVELDRAEQVAVVGHRDRRHLERAGLADEAVDLIRPVEEAVLGVDVKVDELGARHAVLCQ